MILPEAKRKTGPIPYSTSKKSKKTLVLEMGILYIPMEVHVKRHADAAKCSSGTDLQKCDLSIHA